MQMRVCVPTLEELLRKEQAHDDGVVEQGPRASWEA